jgi:hypothetical protein
MSIVNRSYGDTVFEISHGVAKTNRDSGNRVNVCLPGLKKNRLKGRLLRAFLTLKIVTKLSHLQKLLYSK